ncbi:helix-turn-helix domain-containing protein [Gracilibacillus sp. YIM 98692]|uniref:helix-turn-helix domain-containing protein n=1 Tax=Gracilibacillus sp. YIM 98692 TaxID=2663532 RepID=UPI0013D1EB80|nr:helix-turn-helix domain-containing protein [Gracilibacillus sp. YIM 98692]
MKEYKYEQNHPIIRKTALEEYFILLYVYKDDQYKGMFVVGPILYYPISRNIAKGLANDHSVYVKTSKILDHYNRLSLLSHDTTVLMGKLLYFLVFQKKVSNIELYDSKYINGNVDKIISTIELAASNRRQDQDFHPPFSLEREVFQCIKEGRKEDLLKHHQIRHKLRPAVLAKNSYVRNKKNFAISAITLATRSAIDGGINHELAKTLSDEMIVKVEEAKTANQVIHLHVQALETFAEYVYHHKRNKYSKLLKDCLDYIYMYIYEELSLTELAEFVNVSPGYISTQFKKEVGMPVSHYIQKEKVEEAKKLMSFTNQSLTEISQKLQFTDQSYFTKIFKKYTNITPKQYKNQQAIHL